jgi:hypothetical protein
MGRGFRLELFRCLYQGNRTALDDMSEVGRLRPSTSAAPRR